MTEHTDHPFPKAPGGLQGATFGRPMRTMGTLRQPDLGQPPNVVSVTGVASASIRNEGSAADQSQGLVVINTGPAPSQFSCSVVLRFPAGIVANQYIAFSEQGPCSFSGIGGGQATLNLAYNTQAPISTQFVIAYQWAVST